jgi:hypothetical protein
MNHGVMIVIRIRTETQQLPYVVEITSSKTQQYGLGRFDPTIKIIP